MARLVVLQGGEAKTYELTAPETVMGRHPECTIQLESNMVSRKHARVLRDGAGFFIEDMGSGNGTQVNGAKTEGKALLRHEDRIKLGPILLRFEDLSAVAAKKNSGSVDKDKTTPGVVAGGAPFKLEVSGGEDDASMIMGSVSGSTLFASFTVRPEAKLKAVVDITRALAGTVELQTILPRILDSLFSIFPQADRGCILLKEEGHVQMVPRAIKHRRASDDESVKLSRTILNKVLTEKTGILSADAANDARFNASESISNFTIRSMMCVPMLGLDGEPLGVINIDTQNPLKQFQNEDLELLMAVAGQAAVTYENARLLVSFMEKEKQDREMDIAREVQRALLPEQMPELPGYEFFASYESAQAVGGDYYGCQLKNNGQKVCLAFGDVAGKGVPASLVMSRLSSIVQSTFDFLDDVGAACEKINNHMCVNAVEGRFVTFTLVFLDTVTHEIAVVIAGHMSPMIRKIDGSIEEFPDEIVGLPIGVVDGLSFDVARRKLEPGETIVIYTDGVSEAMNPASDLYGMDHLRDFITKGPSNPTELGTLILKDVKRHASGRYQNDDITLMTFGRVK
jgi:sigma-B regulation protein RsbU (phosphoserine phosphatase)